MRLHGNRTSTQTQQYKTTATGVEAVHENTAPGEAAAPVSERAGDGRTWTKQTFIGAITHEIAL